MNDSTSNRAGRPSGLPALDDEHAPLFTVGQVASMLEVQQAFLRRIDDQQVVSPKRSAGGQRRYSRHDIGQVQQVVTMMGEGMTLPAIRHIITLQYQLADLRRERDELAARLHALSHPATSQEGTTEARADGNTRSDVDQ
jgi:MerR family transcriptional regulator, heat shock protein HspR